MGLREYKILDHRVLTEARKITVLESHGVEYKISGETLYAIEVYIKGGNTYTEPVDTTGWILKDLQKFLGY